MHQIALIIQWITALVILLELAVIFINVDKKVYSLLYMLCVSLLVSSYAYLLHLYATTEEALYLTSLVVWAGKTFALVTLWRFSLSICGHEFSKKVQIVDWVLLSVFLVGLTTTKKTHFFISDIHMVHEGDWYYLQYHRGIGYYQYYFFAICAFVGILHLYIKLIRNMEDKNRKRQYTILLITTMFSPGIGLISFLPVGVYYDFSQIGFLASSVTMLIAMIKYKIGDLEQFTKDFMFNELSSGVIAMQDGGKNAFYNKTALTIFPELENDSEKVVENIQSKIRSGENITFEGRIYSPEEKKLEDNSTLLVLTDSTRHYQYIDEVEKQRKIADSANKAKTDFLANMSHEIRTPINTVLGMDEMILRESRDSSIKGYAMDIKSAGRSLLSIINDILDLSKIEAGKMEIVPVEYGTANLLRDVSNIIYAKADEKALSFEVSVDPGIPARLFGDDVRIRQILMNLLTNAVKYTPNGHVWLRAYLVNNGDSDNGSEDVVRLHFEVEDTGIGIKQEDMGKLFANFERIDLERNRSIEGTGLGIPITMKLIELMGSELVVSSEYGKGSIFSFDLLQKVIDNAPIGDIKDAVSEEYSYSESFMAPEAKILLVDDNGMNRKVIVSLLKATRIDIVEAESGPEAIEKTSKEHFDIIFMDHMMPDMDGVEAMKRIKEDKDGPCAGTPIIALTANAISGAKEKYLEDGFDGFLSKPVIYDKLESIIKEFLPGEKLVFNFTDEISRENMDIDTDDLPMIFGLDWRVALMRLQNKDVLDSVLENFELSIDQQADTLQKYKDGLPDTFEDYRILVHAMKSGSGSAGIFTLSGMAALLEKAASGEDADTINQLHDVFIREWRGFKGELKAYLEKDAPSESEKEVIPDEILKTLLDMLAASMDDMDIDGADDAIEKLSFYKLPGRVEAEFDELRSAVSRLDQEEVARIIERVK